jgi:spermidine synthase
VIDHADGERTLELNEGQAIHSLYRPDTVLTGGYWDGFLVAPFAVLREPPRRVAMLGFAGGTVARAYARYFPRARIDGVEIDSELFDIGRRYFGLRPRPQLHEYGEDARPFLRRIDARYHVIYLDTYRQPYIPFYLSTREFFELARSRLAPGGLLVVNLGHPEGSDALEKVLSATMGTAFAHVARDPMEPTNTLLMASREPITRANLLTASRPLPEDLRPLAQRSSARLAPPPRGGAVYTDDKAPVEWLVDKSIVEYAAGGGG